MVTLKQPTAAATTLEEIQNIFDARFWSNLDFEFQLKQEDKRTTVKVIS